jgi:signal transduction histidine kinase
VNGARHQVLQRSLDLLAHESDVDGFLGRVLGEIGGRLDAHYIVIWLIDGKPGTAALRLAWSETHGPGRADDLLPPELARSMLERAEHLAHETLPALDTGALLHLPLWIGGHNLGGFAVVLAGTGQVTAVEIEWAQALANQATFALRLDSLAAEREAAAVLKERARMAREIHDGIAQTFVGISRHLRSVPATADVHGVARALELSKDGLAEARRVVKALGPRQLGNMSFVEAVRDAATKIIPQPIQFRFSSTGTWPNLSPDRETHLFRAIQEAFNNVARHSFATELSVDLSSMPDGLTVLIQDNGRGFDVHRSEAGFGLRSMRERIDGIRGFFEMVSAPGCGTKVVMGLRDAGALASRRA